MSMDARTLYFTAPGSVERRPTELDAPTGAELLVETAASGVSAGSELLVYRGEFPEDLAVDETIDALDGSFEYPLAYGYSAVGEVVAAGDAAEGWVGDRVFAFVPHADRFVASTDSVVRLPDDVSTPAATLLPTVETATNLTLDGAPRLGERVTVFGAGPVGLCTIAALARFPLADLRVVEPLAHRREVARAFGADAAIEPGDPAAGYPDADPAGADLVYELSGRPETLDAAVDAAGYDARVVVGSWYGSKRASVDLGGSFHRDRIDLVSSQVSTIAPELRGRWDRSRRFDVALDRLAALDADALVTHRVPFGEAGRAYELLDARADNPLHVLFEYP
jgi:2-desacetyl-2-hydroxyethyl bacteriochlorophyllide A dehydrogenase